MFPCYPPAIIKAAKDPPTGVENRFYWLWICFGELLPLLLYGAVSTMEGWDNRVLASGPDRVYPVDDGQFLRPVLSGFLADSEEGEKPVYHSGDRRAPRLRVQRVDERLRSAGAPAPVAVFDVPHPGGGPGRWGLLIDIFW